MRIATKKEVAYFRTVLFTKREHDYYLAVCNQEEEPNTPFEMIAAITFHLTRHDNKSGTCKLNAAIQPEPGKGIER